VTEARIWLRGDGSPPSASRLAGSSSNDTSVPAVAIFTDGLTFHATAHHNRLADDDPDGLAQVIRALESVQADFNASASGDRKVSFADLVVLGGAAAVEKAAKDAGHDVTVPFTPGRTDTTQDKTDVESFAYLEPSADGFRHFRGEGHRLPSEYLHVDRANLLNLSAPEMTVLVGDLRVLGANSGGWCDGGRARRQAGHADERLLHQPTRHGCGVEVGGR
jgi:hypothetical protein